MLTAADALRNAGRRRPPLSPKQLYQEYVMQRIEAYKESISRDELMNMVNDAVIQQNAANEGQFLLADILLNDMVDQFIIKRLKLKSEKRFKEKFVKLRGAQREPTHWGLDATCPVVPLLGRLEASDRVLVIGSNSEARACLLAAYEVDVVFWAGDVGLLARLEQRVATESLAARFFTMLVTFDGWVPECEPFDLVVLDLSAIADLDSPARFDALRAIQSQTHENGLHVLIPSTTLVPEAVFTFYDGWERETSGRRRRGAQKAAGCVLIKPTPARHLQAARA